MRGECGGVSAAVCWEGYERGIAGRRPLLIGNSRLGWEISKSEANWEEHGMRQK